MAHRTKASTQYQYCNLLTLSNNPFIEHTNFFTTVLMYVSFVTLLLNSQKLTDLFTTILT